ncbi:protoporphyrinogen/coproporphyrinogen oxidase [Schumannella luteola]
MAAADAVTVVGGGVAGLVAARRIARTGRPVRLLEATGRLGGTLARQRVGDIELDAGAESFATRGGTVATLAAELGLRDEVVPPLAQPAWLHTAGRGTLPLPATGVLGIPGAPLAADVIAVVGLPAALRAQLDSLIPALRPRPDATLGSIVRRRMGAGVLRRLVAPVVHGVHSADPDDLLLDRAVPGLGHLLAGRGSLAAAVRDLRADAPPGSAVAGIRGGVNRLVTELVADLVALGADIRLDSRVDSPAAVAGDVVWAAPLTSGGREITLATLVLDAPELDSAPRGTGVLVDPDARDVAARALTHSTAKWPWLAERAAGRHVVRLSYDAPPESLAEVARRDAATLLGVGLPESSVVDFARVSWTRPAPATAGPAGVLLLGESVAGSGIAGIVAHANRSVDEWLAPREPEGPEPVAAT